jgi:hypothetical protein
MQYSLSPMVAHGGAVMSAILARRIPDILVKIAHIEKSLTNWDTAKFKLGHKGSNTDSTLKAQRRPSGI